MLIDTEIGAKKVHKKEKKNMNKLLNKIKRAKAFSIENIFALCCQLKLLKTIKNEIRMSLIIVYNCAQRGKQKFAEGRPKLQMGWPTGCFC